MGWLIFVIVIASAIIELLLGWFFGSINTLGPWAFRRRPDGSVSCGQILAQIMMLGPLAIVCTGMPIYAMIDTVRRVIG